MACEDLGGTLERKAQTDRSFSQFRLGLGLLTYKKTLLFQESYGKEISL